MKNLPFYRFLRTRMVIFLVPPAILAALLASPAFSISSQQGFQSYAADASVNKMLIAPENPNLSVEHVEVFPARTHDNFSVSYSVSASSLVTIDLLDMQGKLVDHLHNRIAPSGNFQTTFDVTDKYYPCKYIVKTSVGGSTNYNPITIEN